MSRWPIKINNSARPLDQTDSDALLQPHRVKPKGRQHQRENGLQLQLISCNACCSSAGAGNLQRRVNGDHLLPVARKIIQELSQFQVQLLPFIRKSRKFHLSPIYYWQIRLLLRVSLYKKHPVFDFLVTLMTINHTYKTGFVCFHCF